MQPELLKWRLKVGEVDMSEIELLARARLGDREALGELLQRHQKKVYSAALALTGNREESLDLTQETFMMVCRKVGQCRWSFLPWTLRIMRNVFVSKVRRKKGNEIPVPSEDLTYMVGEEMAAEERAEANLDCQAVLAALAEIPEDYRWVLVLRHIEDLPVNEIALTLEMKEGTVKSKLHRGRLLLREKLVAGSKGGKSDGL